MMRNNCHLYMGAAYERAASSVAFMHAAYSAGFLKGCIAADVVLAQSGFHFLFFFSLPGLFASQHPSLVMSNISMAVTPFFLMHSSANKSSPMGPYLPLSIPIFQLLTVSVEHVSMLATKMLKAVLSKTSRFPKKPYFTFSQFTMKAPVGGTGASRIRSISLETMKTASAPC